MSSSPFRKTEHLNCPVEHAFDVFTTLVDMWWPPSHKRFENSNLHLETHVGGRFFERSKSGDEAVLGEVLTYRPPNSISYTWNPGKVSAPTMVKVTFAAQGNHTIVQVIHTEADSALGDQWSEKVALFERGWNAVFASFTTYISENG